MEDISPLQKVYTRIRQVCVATGYDVYDYRPDEVEYPFIFLGEQVKQNDRLHKDGLTYRTQVTLHVWHNNPRQRGTFTSILDEIERGIIEEFGVRGEDIYVTILGDPEDSRLIHGVIDTNIEIK